MMTRREFVKTPLQAAAAAQLMQSSRPVSGGGKTNSPPNILFIMADQVTPFMLAAYGQKVAHTPNLDRLARSGTVFDAAYCGSPLCVPSRMTMFTGRLPHKVMAYDNASEFSAHLPTFVHYLRRAGYRTAVAGKTHFVGGDQLHGFDERLSPCIYPADFAWTWDWRLEPRLDEGTSVESMLRLLGPSKWSHQLGFDQMTFDRAMARLREHALEDREKQPLFLNVSFTQPHDPFTTTQHYLDLYQDANIPPPQADGDILRLSPTYEWFQIFHGIDRVKLSPATIREARRNYLGMISWVDDRVGELLAELHRLGLGDNTVVIFTSDHGEMLGEHRQWSKSLMLEWSCRVPLIISAPGLLPQGKRIAAPVSLIDLFPTFTDLVNVKIETDVDGRSLLPLIQGAERGDDRVAVAEYLGEGTLEPIRMVRSGPCKYITVNGYPPQLYDLSSNPNETLNLAGRPEYSQAEGRLRELAEKDWDGPALKQAVLQNQQERLLVLSVKRKGDAPHWDYSPIERGPYNPFSDYTDRSYNS